LNENGSDTKTILECGNLLPLWMLIDAKAKSGDWLLHSKKIAPIQKGKMAAM